MSSTDWLVLVITLFSTVLYGMWKSRRTISIESYLLADRQLPWYHVCLSVMATQASAITFLSAPGQAYTDGLRFVQFYFGLPIAMVVLCITFIPKFHKLNVFTAYEYLEKRFDVKTRSFTAFLFLLQRGLSTGITIYAPAIVLSAILNIDINYTTIFMGGVVMLYTTYGGTRAVSYTHLLQMVIIFGGLFFAAWMVVHLLPVDVGFVDALRVAGKMQKLNAIDTGFDWNNKYNIWSGIIGGFFLQLSYFGTDQSQVGRYLTGKSIAQSRLGLLVNGLVKIPMQFFILLIGTLVFTFYQFNSPPIFFNKTEIKKIENSTYHENYKKLEKAYIQANEEKQKKAKELINVIAQDNEQIVDAAQLKLLVADSHSQAIREQAMALMKENDSKANVNDGNYIFLHFITQHLPVGLVGLLIAIIFLASMGSMASGLNSLASTTIVDFYKRFSKKEISNEHEVAASRYATMGWGIFCIVVGLYAGRLGNLIEVVNILGSLFYGTILGIFLVAFYLKKVGGAAVFYAAIVSEIFVVIAWLINLTAFLWLNVIGCLLVMGISVLLNKFFQSSKR